MAQFDSIVTNDRIRGEWRTLVSLALQSLAIGLIVSLVLGLAVFIISFEARAADNNDVGQGAFLLRDDGGEKVWRHSFSPTCIST